MPTFVLWAKAELEGLSEFWAPDDHCWVLDVKQGGGAEERKGVVIDPDDWVELTNTKDAKANFVMKFDKGDKQQSYCTVTQIKGLTRHQTADDTGMVPLIAFECRGLEPVKWTPTGPYCAKAGSGTTWEDVDIRTDDWCEYDEKGDAPVSVGKDIKYEFRLHR
ncbi:hypothetical protein AB1Y20_018920 [Prymnesium parvum]|uniref:Uncharacterized protein n=1 Tax=Prymnesium parvum TaxID=97485 RepID=A0AB34JTI4_PRYPA